MVVNAAECCYAIVQVVHILFPPGSINVVA